MKIALYIYLFVFIFLGGINSFKYELFISYVDIANLTFLLYFFFFSIIKKRSYFFEVNKVDRILLTSIAFLTIPSLVFNDKIHFGYLFTHFYPIRIFLTYKIFSFIYFEYEVLYERPIKFSDFTKPLIILGVFSAFLSIIRYMPNDVGFLINDIWPITSNGKIVPQLVWGRLWGTMGGTNTVGNFFTILSFICLYYYHFKNRSKYVYPFLLFSLCVAVSLSFTSIISYAFGIFFIFYKKINLKILAMFIILFLGVVTIISQNEALSYFVEKRIAYKFGSGENTRWIPSNLVDRVGYWISFLELSFSHGLHALYGWGPGGLRLLYWDVVHANPESFYFRIFNEAGIIGIIALIYVFYQFFFKLSFLKKIIHFKNESIIINLILILVLIQNIANETLYSNGVSQIVSFLIFYISYQYSNIKKALNQRQYDAI